MSLSARSPVLLGVLGAAAALLGGRIVLGMDSSIGNDAATCQWYPTVRVGPYCTGTYVGNGVVLTAAHCFYDSVCAQGQPQYDGPPGTVKFGEDEDAPAIEVDVVGSALHPEGHAYCTPQSFAAYAGVDLAYLLLEEPPAGVVGIPPAVPTGCERDWLSRQVRSASPGDAMVMAVGMGCESGSCNAPGIKRFVGEEFPDQVDVLDSDPLDENDPQHLTKRMAPERFGGDTGLLSGDSGGPTYARLPDGTWRLIGVLHAGDEGTQGPIVQLVPPYLAWIEKDAARDITPCHELDESGGNWGRYLYEWGTGCDEAFPKNPGEEQDDWVNGCVTNLQVGGPREADFLQKKNECYHWPSMPPTRLVAPF